MEKKKGVGRKKLPTTERKAAVIIWVKQKHASKAKKECIEIQKKYEAIA